jgi:hypothetical protein
MSETGEALLPSFLNLTELKEKQNKIYKYMNWISVKDQKPPVNTPMLVTDGKHILCCRFRLWINAWSNKAHMECEAHNVIADEHLGVLPYGEYGWPKRTTYWMPLPELPSQN